MARGDPGRRGRVRPDHRRRSVDPRGRGAREERVALRRHRGPRQPDPEHDRRLPPRRAGLERLQARGQLRLEQGPLPRTRPHRLQDQGDRDRGFRRRGGRRLVAGRADLEGRGRGQREARVRGHERRPRPRLTPGLSSTAVATTATDSNLTAQRRALPDAPGVYLFKDRKGKVLYVGKARSIRKRVGSHFSKPRARGAGDMIEQIDQIDFMATQTEAEALLTEQRFIRQHRPVFNIRLRDDKSYPYIAISLDEDFPRVYFTREKHRRGRAYFGPFSNAKRVRETLTLLGKVFQHRTCEGTEPGRASGSPCLDYFIKRCGAPCVGYVSKEEYRRNIDSIIDFLSGRYRQLERELEEEMHEAALGQEFEQAAGYRNKLKAVRSLLERQRVANEAVGTLDAIAVAAEGTDANAQVFQVRDGVLADRQSFYLENAARRDEPEVVEEFVLQYYATAL